jgi:hypothetical protein
MLAVASAVAFVIVRPPVGDLLAAQARQSAAANGVGLTYWFAWFSGGATPGHYSVLTPYLSVVFSASGLGAAATIAITPLSARLVQGSRHPQAAVWVATIASGLSLWSGRVPFAVGTAVSLGSLIAQRGQRRFLAAAMGGVTALVSPVSAVLLALVLIGPLLACRSYRTGSAATILSTGAVLLAIDLSFGTPGPEGFRTIQAVTIGVALILLLVARPPNYVTIVILCALAACPVLLAIPNGLGSNFERLIWVCLPIAVVATARRPLGVALLAVGLSLGSSAVITARDLSVAANPLSSVARYAPLSHELDGLPSVANFRVEVVPDGTHTASFALLAHAALAGGYETQVDNALDATLHKRTLTAAGYRRWLDDNAVGYVALGTRTLKHTSERRIVGELHVSYLKQIWANRDWRLFRVESPRPIAAAPGAVIDADQSNLVITVARPGAVRLRVHWSSYLEVSTTTTDPVPPTVTEDHSWTVLHAPRAGIYVLTG